MRGGRTTSLTLFDVSSLRVRPIVSRSGVPRGCWMVVRSLLLGPLFHGLSTPQRQQLSIRGEDLSHGECSTAGAVAEVFAANAQLLAHSRRRPQPRRP